jgi:hypothetical protein
MNNSAIVVKINKIVPHPDADKIQLAKLFGTQVIVGLDTKEGDILVYVDSNMKMSPEFLRENNLYRHSNLNKDTTKSGFFDDNGRVKAIKMRGEISDGFLFPLNYLNYTDSKFSMTELDIGREFTELWGKKICEKYIPPSRTPGSGNGSSKNTGRKYYKTPMFVEHFDTSQFMRNQHKIPAQTVVYIEEKVHGTSHRTGRVEINLFDQLPWWRKLLTRILGITESTAWIYLNGTRRVVHDPNRQSNPYHDNGMREEVLEHLKKGKVFKGEELYMELFGYEKTGKMIQKDFPYGCKPNIEKLKDDGTGPGTNPMKIHFGSPYRTLLYRITMNNEDGKVADYPREYVYNRAEELGLEKPKLITKFYYSGSKYSMKQLELTVINAAQGQSEMGEGAEDTLKEGVVLWFINDKGFWECLKYKSDKFRLKESGMKDKGIIDQEDLN